MLNFVGANNAQFVIFHFLHVESHITLCICDMIHTDEKLINFLHFHQKYFIQVFFVLKGRKNKVKVIK